MMNGVIVIKEHRKQYKSVEKQGLVSLVPLFMEQTYFKAIFFFSHLFLRSLRCPFKPLLFVVVFIFIF